jgi:genome maintenance exonuclease 1
MADEEIRRVEINGRRYYQISKDREILGLFPSVTTILGDTSDKSGLVKWRERVGEKEADRISKNSTSRGTVMHRLIELYKPLTGDKDEKLETIKWHLRNDREIKSFDEDYITQGFEFFMKFYNNSSQFFDRVERVLAAEKFLWSVKGGGYAGTVDNVSQMTDGKVLVIDYKNSRKPKIESWIQDYFLQASAYVVAYWERTGIKPNGVEIWIANEPDNCPQIFRLTESDIKIYFKLFQERLAKFKLLK